MLARPRRGKHIDLAQAFSRRRSAKSSPFLTCKRTQAMKLWQDLLYTDYGLLSLIVILITLAMAVWYVRFFLQKMAQPPGKE
jgi:hypothetical protein